MVSFSKQDHYGNSKQVFLGPCLCDYGQHLTDDQVHTHKIATIKDEYSYVRKFMHHAEQQEQDRR